MHLLTLHWYFKPHLSRRRHNFFCEVKKKVHVGTNYLVMPSPIDGEQYLFVLVKKVTGLPTNSLIELKVGTN